MRLKNFFKYLQSKSDPMLSFLAKINDYGFLDKVYSFLENLKNKSKTQTTNFKRIEIKNSDNSTWVCFLPWRVSLKEAKKIGLIPKRGRVLVYEIPDNLINPNPSVAKNLLRKVFENITSLNLKNFNVLAYSAGTYPGFFVANHLNAKKMVAVAPGSELGNFYDSIATSKIK